MTGNLWQDWPVYMLLGLVAAFYIYAIIKSNQGQKEKKVERPTEQDNK